MIEDEKCLDGVILVYRGNRLITTLNWKEQTTNLKEWVGVKRTSSQSQKLEQENKERPILHAIVSVYPFASRTTPCKNGFEDVNLMDEIKENIARMIKQERK